MSKALNLRNYLVVSLIEVFVGVKKVLLPFAVMVSFILIVVLYPILRIKGVMA